MRRKRRGKREEVAATPVELSEAEMARRRDPRQPLWEPEGMTLAVAPAAVQQMLHEVLRPFYERFVVQATDALEQSLAMTLVHLMWLEVLHQQEVKWRLVAHFSSSSFVFSCFRDLTLFAFHTAVPTATPVRRSMGISPWNHDATLAPLRKACCENKF